jgi:WD40 repeat protein
LLHLGVDLAGYDFSRLAVWRAYLRGVALPHVNFVGADFTGSVFIERVGRISTVVFSPDGRLLAAGTRNGAIHLWRTTDQQLVQVIHAHTNSITDLAFYQHPAAEGETQLWLASAGQDQTVGLWQMIGDAEQRWHGQLLRGHQQPVIRVRFRAAPSGRPQHLASVDTEGSVRVWEIATGRLAHGFSSHPTERPRAAFNHGGQILAVAIGGGPIGLWQVMSSNAQNGPDGGSLASSSLLTI